MKIKQNKQTINLKNNGTTYFVKLYSFKFNRIDFINMQIMLWTGLFIVWSVYLDNSIHKVLIVYI